MEQERIQLDNLILSIVQRIKKYDNDVTDKKEEIEINNKYYSQVY